jgi:hypothetical protein
MKRQAAMAEAQRRANELGVMQVVWRAMVDDFWVMNHGIIRSNDSGIVATVAPEATRPACDMCGTTEAVETAAPFGPELAVTRCRLCWERHERVERDATAGVGGARRRR